MSFVKREIKVEFILANGTLSGTENNTLILDGHRVELIVNNPGGNAAFGMLQMHIYGMTMEEMNAFSTNGVDPLAYQPNMAIVSAGDAGKSSSQIFYGQMLRSYIEMSHAPEVFFVVSASSTLLAQATTIPSNSFHDTDLASAVEAIAKQAGYGFSNNGVSVVVQNQYLPPDSPIGHIQTLCEAASVPVKIENNIVYIWPNDGHVDDREINLSPENGLVGYPTFTPYGFQITCEFNPAIQGGRKLNLSGSSILKANGTWFIQSITHELTTQAEGPWFTTANLSYKELVVSWN